MSSLLEARCPRCGSDFHCGMDDAGPCGCTGVALDADLQRRLREHFTGCLCLSCLRALADGAALDPAGV
jgi:hypothetical protein